MARSKTAIREHFCLYFPAFKIPDEFDVADLPRLWKEQGQDLRYEAVVVLDKNGDPVVHAGPPAPVAVEANPHYNQKPAGRPRKNRRELDVDDYWRRQDRGETSS